MERKWFGREPQLWIQTLGQLLALAAGFGLPLSDALSGSIVALVTAVFGVWTAWQVRPMAPTIWTSVIVAGAGLVAALGYEVPSERVALLTAAAVAVMTLITRAQTTPAHDPQPGITSSSTPQRIRS